MILLLWGAQAFRPLRTLNFRNRCNQTIWVGAFGIPQPSSTGWQMDSGAIYSLTVDANTKAARFWARTDCETKDGRFQCKTGDCGAPLNGFGIECKGITGQSPATLIEITMANNGFPDFYDLSNVDGYNIAVGFGPTPGTYQKVDNPDLGKFNCGKPGCTLNTKSCPPQLQLVVGSNIYCLSICAAVFNADQVAKYPDILGPIAKDDLKRDLVCCACGPGNGGCIDPSSHFCCSPLDPRQGIGGRCYVQNWPKPSANSSRYDRVFKDQCEQAYSWQFDDVSSTYQCIDGDYDITFCPTPQEQFM